jgi:hypothetical protein
MRDGKSSSKLWLDNAKLTAMIFPQRSGAVTLLILSCLATAVPVPVHLSHQPCASSCNETSQRIIQDVQQNFTARAWVPPILWPGFSYPEVQLAPELQERANTALCFSGGGLRSFTSSLGYLSALSKLGLLQKVHSRQRECSICCDVL